jgi:hypothetical protein
MVGDMATWHRAADPVLNCDLEALAETVGAVTRIESPGDAARVTRAAVEAATAGAAGTAAAATGDNFDCKHPAPQQGLQQGSSCGPSVVTVIMPHDVSWQPAPEGANAGPPAAAASTCSSAAVNGAGGRLGGGCGLASHPGAQEFIRGCAEVNGVIHRARGC